MEALIVNAEDFTPSVILNPNKNKYEIAGKSRPENVKEFYEPVINWFDKNTLTLVDNFKDFYTELNPFTFDFKLVYFNSATSKMLYDILKKIKNLQNQGIIIKVNWYYNEDDEEIMESGDELSKAVNIPFNYIET
jgi:hypothetical protein